MSVVNGPDLAEPVLRYVEISLGQLNADIPPTYLLRGNKR